MIWFKGRCAANMIIKVEIIKIGLPVLVTILWACGLCGYRQKNKEIFFFRCFPIEREPNKRIKRENQRALAMLLEHFNSDFSVFNECQNDRGLRKRESIPALQATLTRWFQFTFLRFIILMIFRRRFRWRTATTLTERWLGARRGFPHGFFIFVLVFWFVFGFEYFTPRLSTFEFSIS